MDNTLCDYDSQHEVYKQLTGNSYPQSIVGFFRSMKPLKDAIDITKKLIHSGIYDVWILTSPSVKNPSCYTEKREWIEQYFGLEFCRKLIISPDKGLIKGDILIDDRDFGNGKENWSGEFIHFGHGEFETWKDVENYLII